MPRQRPPTSGYARIAQAEEEDGNGYLDDDDEEDADQRPHTISASASRYAPIQPQPHGHMRGPSDAALQHNRAASGDRRRRARTNSGVDIKAINARLERWADEIAAKFKIHKVRGKSRYDEQLEIHHSVFTPPDGMRPATAETLASDAADGSGAHMTKLEFDDIVETVKVAIELGIHPKMITQGSSGSYFAKNSEGKTVGVFKPKDEEPYASRNPKWTKWIHRNLFPCFFGRACLIPNLSYVSEAAAYVLDSRLRTNLVPYTDIVYLSSKSFFYEFWDRSNYYRKKKPLPAKVGSFQVFLTGFKDANVFLRDHPWPDQTNSGFRPQDAPERRKKPWTETCKPGRATSIDGDEERGMDQPLAPEDEARERKFHWSDAIKQAFREELEKLVILDYIMRNTDRGLDNWMVKVDWEHQKVSIVTERPKMNGDVGGDEDESTLHPVPVRLDGSRSSDSQGYRRQETMNASSRSSTPSNGGKGPSMSLGAIDNSLSWPWKHPDAWRSFPFGWLFLPVSLIGQPFSQKTRDHFLPLLASTQWWTETQMALKNVFSQDADFKSKMFARQIAVMKGQAWNVLETLKTPDHGPLELCRRARVCVWDDVRDVPVAIPLRVPSAEMRRRGQADMQQEQEEEEMDISSANGPRPAKQHDLLGLSPPRSELPNPNRFDLSRNNSSADLGQQPEEPGSPATIHNITFDRERISEANTNGDLNRTSRPTTTRSRTRASLEAPKKSRISGSHRRRYSHYGSTAFLYDGDDDGDLGYAAAEGMEGNQRKVIIERLDYVKSKNPVFTWC